MDQPQSESISISDAADQLGELLGDDYAGDEPITDEPTQELDDVELSDDDGEGESQDEEPAEEAEPEDEDPEQSFESVADVAEALEIPLEELLDTLSANVKINGVEESVTLKELSQGYQKDADYRQKTTELATQRNELVEIRQQEAQHFETQTAQLGQFLQQAQRVLLGEMNQPEMQQLRETNPAEWTARNSEYQQRGNAIQQMMQQAANQYQAHQQHNGQQLEAAAAERGQKEYDSLLNVYPDWNGETKTQVDNYLAESFGYTQQELSKIDDHRLAVMAHKAMQFDKQSQEVTTKTDVAKKKVKKLPKLQAPAKQKSAIKVRAGTIGALKSRAKKSGNLQDAANYLEQLL